MGELTRGWFICCLAALVALPVSAKIVTYQPYSSELSGDYVASPAGGWDGAAVGPITLGYRFSNGTNDLSGTTEQDEVLRAMQLWSKYANITWVPKTPNQTLSVDIGWYTGNHGDGNSFDGAGGVLAHAFFPSPPNSETIAGDLHFDDAETWTTSATSGTNLYTVAIHELGHSLGLDHSADTKAIMYAFYSGGAFGNALSPDDIAGIRSLYSAKYPTFSASVRGTHTWREDLFIKVGVKNSVGGTTLWETDVHLGAGGNLDDFDYSEIDLTGASAFANGANDWFVSIQDVFPADSGTLQEFSIRFGTPGNWTTLFSPDIGSLIDNGTKVAYIQNVVIPEPGTLSVLAISALTLLTRRSRTA